MDKLSFSNPPTFTPEQEANFQNWIKSLPWYLQFKQQYGVEPDLDPGNSMYDYRTAWQSGISPKLDEKTESWHWQSYDPKNNVLLKMRGHPTLHMELNNWPREFWPDEYR